MLELLVNGKRLKTRSSPDTPLLWFLREELGLTGTKYSCGVGFCGSCSVLINGESKRSCLLTIRDCIGSSIVTIEGIPQDHPVKRAWFEERVPECGYCQPGQIISAIALLNKNPSPSAEDINIAMDNNLCRCGTYNRIKRAILRASRAIKS